MTIPTGPILADLAMLVGQLSKQLDHLTAASRAGPTRRGIGDADLVRHLIAARRSRDAFIPADLLGEPGWDILLDLYVSEAEGRVSYSSSCCLAAAVPQTTGLRYIKRLASAGLVTETADANDSRRTLIALTDAGREALNRWLLQWRRSRAFACDEI